MAIWMPISGRPLQETESGNQASGYVLKFYEPGTTTPLTMATDDTGGTTTTSFLLDTQGYTTNGGVIVTPHSTQSYKIILYLNQTDADADDTGSAVYVVDDISVAEPYLGVPSNDGDSLQSTIAGVRSWGTVSAVGAVPNVVTITSDTTYNLGAGVTAIEVMCLGGGSGGCGSETTGTHLGAGGGSGGTAITYISDPDSSYAVVVGTGGAGGSYGGGGAGGSAGTDTTFGTVCKGTKGSAATSGVPGHGKVGTMIGDITIYGVSGQAGWFLGTGLTNAIGGRGGGYGSNGGDSTDAPANSGAGGNGGDYPNSGSSGDGSAGGSGIVIVKEYS